jgi:hypothetical protein
MKKTLILVSALALTLLGCTTAKQAPSPATTNVAESARMTRMVRRAGNIAELGTRAYLVNHPEDRAQFDKVRMGLRGLAAVENYEPLAFSGIMQQLPINKLSSDEGALYVTAFIMLWDEIQQEAITIDKQAATAQVLFSVLGGFDRALDPPVLTGGKRSP